MTRYRLRGIFLLLLMGHATACAGGGSSWQAPGSTVFPNGDVIVDVSVADYIEENQLGSVRIIIEDGTQFVMSSPFVEVDDIVSTKRVEITNPQGSKEWTEGQSVLIADIARLEPTSPSFGQIAVILVIVPVLGLLLKNVPKGQKEEAPARECGWFSCWD